MSNDNKQQQEDSGAITSPAQTTVGQGNEANLVSAKRKHWIEWQCLLDKFPSEDRLEELKRDMEDYIRAYLDNLYDKKYQSVTNGNENGAILGIASKHGGVSNPLEDIEQQVDLFFKGETESQRNLLGRMGNEGVPIGNPNGAVVLFEKLKKGVWIDISKQDYNDFVIENNNLKIEQKHILRCTLYSRKWMSIFYSDWEHVSDSHSVFSYKGWFVTRNNIRLTSENRGSMNPPPPPPPPQP